MKRKIERPHAVRRRGGWILSISKFLEILKKGDAVRVENVTVGSKNLSQLLKTLPGEFCRVSVNGRLEIETVQLVSRKQNGGTHKVGFVKPRHYYNWFALNDGAWISKPHMMVNPVILKPRKLSG